MTGGGPGAPMDDRWLEQKVAEVDEEATAVDEGFLYSPLLQLPDVRPIGRKKIHEACFAVS